MTDQEKQEEDKFKRASDNLRKVAKKTVPYTEKGKKELRKALRRLWDSTQ